MINPNVAADLLGLLQNAQALPHDPYAEVGLAVSRTIPLSVQSKQDWQTPRWLFKRLAERYPFTLDAAATAENALCPKWCVEGTEFDGLKAPWDLFTYCNPPYKSIKPWVDKAAYEADERGVTSVLLLPARLETSWYFLYHRFAMTEIITPRLAFEGGEGTSPPHGSLLLIFTPETVSNPTPLDGQPRIRIVEYRKD